MSDIASRVYGPGTATDAGRPALDALDPMQGLRTPAALFRDTLVTRNGSMQGHAEADVRRGDRFGSQANRGGP